MPVDFTGGDPSLEFDGWRWVDPLPNGRRVISGWVGPDGRGLFANTLGVLLFDGQRLWAPDGGFDDLPITDIWGDGPANIWLVGSGGTVLRWNGSRLVTLQPTMPGGGLFTAVAGLRSGEVFIGSLMDGLRWNGASFETLPALPGTFRVGDLFSPDGVTLFALGNSFNTGLRWGVFRWNGAGWDTVLTQLGSGRNLHGQQAEALWLVAGNGVQRLNGLVTSAFADGGVVDGGVDAGVFRVPTGSFSGNPNMVFTTAGSDAGASRVFVAGDGVLEVLPDAGWSRLLIYPPLQHDVGWVGGPPAGPPLFAMGATLVRLDGGAIDIVAGRYQLPSQNTFFYQPMTAGPLHAVSDDVVWLFSGSFASSITAQELTVSDGGLRPLATGFPITATVCHAPRECIVGNQAGQVGVFTGATFLSHGALGNAVTRLVPTANGGVYAMTESGGLGLWRDAGVSTIPLPPGVTAGFRAIRDIGVRPPEELWAIGLFSNGSTGLFRRQASTWEAIGPLADAGWPFPPESVLVRGTSEALVAGSTSFARWDGGSWSITMLPSGQGVGLLTELGGEVFSRGGGRVLRLTDAGVFEPFGPARTAVQSLSVSDGWWWMGFSGEAGVLRRPRP